MPVILLLPPRENPNTAAIQAAAVNCGWEVRQLPNWRAPEDLIGKSGIVAYGEPLFVAAMAEFIGLALLESPFNWLPGLPETYTKRAIKLTSLALARTEEQRIFAKPADDKSFAAGVYPRGIEIKASNLLPGDIPVLISEVVEWEVEYRFFILERQPQTSSVYLRNGDLVDDSPPAAESDDAMSFVQKFLADEQILLPPAVVLDVGIIAARGWAVLEANPAFGAGIYSCNPELVLPVLKRSIIPAVELSQDDRQWVLDRSEV